MRQRREALMARYRSISIDRLRSIREKLEAIAEGNTEALADVRRELHTLKGDSHLLGLVEIGKVAHACEERMLDPRTLTSMLGVIRDALDAIKVALRDDAVDPSAVDEGLRNALAALTMDVAGQAKGTTPGSRGGGGPGAGGGTAGGGTAGGGTAGGGTGTQGTPTGGTTGGSTAGGSTADEATASGSMATRGMATGSSTAGVASEDTAGEDTAGEDSDGTASEDFGGDDAAFGDTAFGDSTLGDSAFQGSAIQDSAPDTERALSAEPAAKLRSRTRSASDKNGEATRWVHVRAHDVDVVCERLSALHAELGRLHATLRGKLAEARDTMHDLERLRSDFDEVVSSAWALRLAPVHPTLAELGEYSLELARTHGKQLRVRIDDGGALIERRLLDEVHEPLLHLVRNAVDHGVEPAHERGDKPVRAELVLSAEGHRDHVVIAVTDDGRGIDPVKVHAIASARGLANPAIPLTEEEAYELLFLQGFSTRQGATDLSGRGVGLDAVRRRVTSIGGRVSLTSTPGVGTRFAIHIPSTLFRERVLVADVGGALCALPAREVEAVVPIAPAMMESVGATPVLHYQGEGIPFLPLPLFCGDSSASRAAIVTHGGQRWAISLPDLVGDVELLRVPVDSAVAALGPFAASGTLDDGRLVLVVSLDALLSHPRQLAHVVRSSAHDRGRRRVLVVDDSPIVRDLLSDLLSSVGLEVRAAGDGAAALEALADRPVDLIVCDVEMPVMDGFELLRRLRDRAERVPVVMVTTRGSADDRALAASLGADALIVKSDFENARLLETVRRFVEIAA